MLVGLPLGSVSGFTFSFFQDLVATVTCHPPICLLAFIHRQSWNQKVRIKFVCVEICQDKLADFNFNIQLSRCVLHDEGTLVFGGSWQEKTKIHDRYDKMQSMLCKYPSNVTKCTIMSRMWFQKGMVAFYPGIMIIKTKTVTISSA